jgi:alpha-L-fucosidase
MIPMNDAAMKPLLTVVVAAALACAKAMAATNSPAFDKPVAVADAPSSSDTKRGLLTLGESNQMRNARMAWWREAKFGMFIHWGVYSQAEGEWKGSTNNAEWLQFTAKIPLAEYERFAATFHPDNFDPDSWAKIAKEAGMKYVVVTAKHHDGFAMFDSPSDPYNIVKATSFGRDPLKGISEACRKNGLMFCVYYSLGRDWHDPDVPTGSEGSAISPPGWRSNLIDFPDEKNKVFSKYFRRKVIPQVKELLTQYGPIGILWFDTPEKISKAESEELLGLIRSLQPDCIVNERVGNRYGDYATPEQQVPSNGSSLPWETCMTLNGHWGFNKYDHNWKSTETLIRNLCDIASKGGNYLLNVGPDSRGVIPAESVKCLAEVGAWMKVNGEAIYGTTATPFGAEAGSFSPTKKDKKGQPLFNPDWTWRATQKPGHLYLILFKWPADGKFSVPAFSHTISGATLLADPSAKLTVGQDEKGITVSGLSAKAPDPIASVIDLKY